MLPLFVDNLERDSCERVTLSVLPSISEIRGTASLTFVWRACIENESANIWILLVLDNSVLYASRASQSGAKYLTKKLTRDVRGALVLSMRSG